MQTNFTRMLGASVLAVFLISAQAFGANLTVTKTPWCGCCSGWTKHMRQSGFDVTVRELKDLTDLKAKMGIASHLQSCHTGEVDGYFIEGHVPAEDVYRLLAEHPKALGLSVPGMVAGSPGMEMGDRKDAYDVILIMEDGSAKTFSRR